MDNQILDDQLIPEEQANRPIRYAGFWIRVGASLLDSLIFAPLIALSFYNLLHLKSLVLQLVILILSGVYKPLFEYYYGATLGKMITGLKVVDKSLNRLTPDQAIIRASPWIFNSLASMIVTIFIFSMEGFAEVSEFMEYTLFTQESDYNWLAQIASWPTIIAAIVVAFDKRKQGLHDMWAKTFCIYK